MTLAKLATVAIACQIQKYIVFKDLQLISYI